MSRETKISPEKKLEAVRLYLNQGIGQNTLSKQFNVDSSTIREWLDTYSRFGVEGLMNHPTDQHDSRETKIKAVTEYLMGNSSQQDICTKYKIRSKTQLQCWIKVYKRGGDLKESTGGAYMKGPDKKIDQITEDTEQIIKTIDEKELE